MDILVAIGMAYAVMDGTTNECPTCDEFNLTYKTAQPSLSVEARGERFGIMASYGEAERDGSCVVGPRYFAVRDPLRPTLVAHGAQTIRARWLGLQGTWTQPVGPIRLRLMAGAAYVDGRNDEYATYFEHGTVEQADNHTSTREVRPLFGAGIEYGKGDWFARLEVQHLPNAVESEWTLSNDITTAGIQLGRKF